MSKSGGLKKVLGYSMGSSLGRRWFFIGSDFSVWFLYTVNES
jgi:hypothetical protein